MLKIPAPAEGQSILDWCQSVAEILSRFKVTSAPGSGIEARKTPEGAALSLKLPPGLIKAKVTQLVQLASADGLTLGTGKATLYSERLSGTTATLKPYMTNVVIYFGAPSGGSTTTIAVGQWVIVGRMATGILEVLTGYC